MLKGDGKENDLISKKKGKKQNKFARAAHFFFRISKQNLHVQHAFL